MDDQRRSHLLAKFPALNNLRPLDPRVSTQVRAIDRAARIVEQVWSWTWEGQDPQDPATVLFDPARVPALAKRADMAAAEYHRRAGEGSLRYDTGDGLNADYDPDDAAEQGVVRIWRVGSNQAYIVRERWRDSPNREWTTTDYFAQLFEFLVEQLDYHDCRKFGCDGNCDLCPPSGTRSLVSRDVSRVISGSRGVVDCAACGVGGGGAHPLLAEIRALVH